MQTATALTSRAEPSRTAQVPRRVGWTPWRTELTEVMFRPTVVTHAAGLALIWLLIKDDFSRLAMSVPLVGLLVLGTVELLRPHLGARGRAWFLVAGPTVLSLVGYLLVGFHSGPTLLACAAILVAQVFFGPRVLVGVALILLAGITVASWGMVSERLPWAFPVRDVSVRESVPWVRTTLVTILLMAVLGALVVTIVNRLEATVRHNAHLYEDAQQAVSVRDEFLSIASHELRTPVAVLKLAAEGLVSGRVQRTPEHLERSVRLIDRNVDRLTALVGQLLDVSRIELGRLDLRLEEVDLSAVVRDVVDLFAERRDEVGPLSLDLDPGVVGRWDRSRLEQVVTNLLSNAVKFGAGKPILVRVRHADGRALLTVQDHGVGIAPDLVPHVFERFVLGSRHGGTGLGLGLFIVESIVRSLGGASHLASKVGEGTIVTVELPIAGPGTGSRAQP